MTDAREIPVNTSAGLITLRLVDNGDVTVNMGIPTFVPADIPLHADAESDQYSLLLSGNQALATDTMIQQSRTVGDSVCFASVAIGNPHAVLQVSDVDSAPVEELGPLLESHTVFPSRVNVGFMEVLTDSEVKLRVFERGVGETDACGTGACAAVATGIRQGLLQRQVTVALRGGKLTIVWPENNKTIEMTGPCSTVFEGQTSI